VHRQYTCYFLVTYFLVFICVYLYFYRSSYHNLFFSFCRHFFKFCFTVFVFHVPSYFLYLLGLYFNLLWNLLSFSFCILSFILPLFHSLTLFLFLLISDTSARSCRNPCHFCVGEVAATSRRTEFHNCIPMLFLPEWCTSLRMIVAVCSRVYASYTSFTGVPGPEHPWRNRVRISSFRIAHKSQLHLPRQHSVVTRLQHTGGPSATVGGILPPRQPDEQVVQW
jgi:hypothetical protein